MGVEGFLAGEDERAARALIEQADLILKANDGFIPAGFAARLFGQAAPEDVRAYRPQELAALARSAYAHLARRSAGMPDIAVASPPPAEDSTARGGQLHAVTVVEIVNDDMPFLLDSVMGELTAQGLATTLVVHPILPVERDSGGALLGLPVAAGRRESLIHIHIERIDDEARRDALKAALGEVLAQVRLAVAAWRPIVDRVRQAVDELRATPPPLPPEEVEEGLDLLEWLLAGNFTFLGYRSYRRQDSDGTGFEPESASALGLLADPELRLFDRASLTAARSGLAEVLGEPCPLIVTKSKLMSRVHRRVWMDVVVLKRFGADGKLASVQCIAGLFTSTAYTGSVRAIPLLRRKVAAVLARAGFSPDSHSGRALVKVLESYPRDDLFQIDEERLLHAALAILQLDEHPRLRVLPFRDRFDRFVSVLVYVPRNRYDTGVSERIGDYLAGVFAGRVASLRPLFLDLPLTRIHIIIERIGAAQPEPDRSVLETAVSGLIRTWADGLASAIGLAHPAAAARALRARYARAFPAGYRAGVTPEAALADIRLIDTLSQDAPVAVDFHRAEAADPHTVGLKVFSFARPRPLSERVPLLEAMGFVVVDERTFTVRPADGTPVFVHDMLLARRGGGAITLDTLEWRLHACLMAVLSGQAESDGFNALVLNAGLGWRDIALVRTLARYLRQVGVPYSQDYLWATLNAHPIIAERLVALFHSRFAPVPAGDAAAIRTEIETALAQVQSLDEDRILRRFANLVEAAVRTNFFQLGADGALRPAIAVKFASGQVEGLPLPHPLFEIFVHSPRVEGIHLRFGRVARGGLRWSDRPQDFRTEVLGLVKAQQVKNAVIVPVGAKGGFVPKHLPAGPREAVQAEGIAAYTLFVGSLMDVTDNIEGTQIIHPADTVRHDADDPYLVVAADKGTATFSDTANGLSEGRGFWLGDAFASGGSVGYDHKKMGITARGAWEAVRRHFREMDVDIRVARFSVAGVGDMSGDVFGNGMLLEDTIQLVAAFDHRDIFLDPDPDPAASFAERRRLFDLPRSSWADYDTALISPGGGVFPRAAKSIALSPQVRAALGIERATLSPAELVSAILRAPVDLLWFGGIGTYVRAGAEIDAQVGDRANDAVRIAAGELRAKVIGEGANLGLTQRGRIEAARRGMRLNTDAIDNSAGVNTSDIEVNIKIALGPPLRDGRLDPDSRAALLASMTDEVAALVLRNNYLQTLALSLAERRSHEELVFHQRLMQELERRGLLDRAVEFLPSDAEIHERRGRGEGLTRPELAVLLAYAKLTLHADLLGGDVPDDAYLGRELERYFPLALRQRFPDGIDQHRLRRDIIATQLANAMINHGGPAFAARLTDATGAAVGTLAKAFAAARDSYGLNALDAEIDALDALVPGAVQLELYAAVQRLAFDGTVWFLRNAELERSLGELVAHYAAGVPLVAEVVERVVPEEARTAFNARVRGWVEAGVPADLARRVATLPALDSSTDIVRIADRTKAPIADVAATFFAIGLHFRLHQVLAPARALSVPDYYDRLALDRALAAFEVAVRRLTAEVLAGGFGAGTEAVAKWAQERGTDVERTRNAVHEIAGSGLTVSKLSVAASLLGDLVRG
ncbi:MAG TPA: NAD-glutamate dehydrogenase [Xanthobacteraceae bacterium]|nr:NAD-glutamate dehydrogenase [Xanthobacteraceae bacterium]